MTADPKSVLGHGLTPGVSSGYELLDPADVRLGVDRGDGVLGTLRPYPEASAAAGNNPLQAIRELLLGIDDIVALVDTRVYCVSLPREPKKNARFPCILVTRVSAVNDPEMLDTRTLLLDVRCYGSDRDGAEALYDVLAGLNGEVQAETANYLVHTFNEVLGGSDLREQVSESEFIDCVYSSWSAEISRR